LRPVRDLRAVRPALTWKGAGGAGPNPGTRLAQTLRMRPRLTFPMACALLAAACNSPSGPSEEPLTFSNTVSFGFCLPSAYCRSRLDISMGRAVLTRESSTQPSLVASRELLASEWRTLVEALDVARLHALPSVIGCPDCADGGAEMLTVAFAGGASTTVTFEYKRDPPGIEALLAQLRTIRRKFPD